MNVCSNLKRNFIKKENQYENYIQTYQSMLIDYQVVEEQVKHKENVLVCRKKYKVY
jgi:hypothetical protein